MSELPRSPSPSSSSNSPERFSSGGTEDEGQSPGRLEEDRRTFLKQAALGGLSMGAVLGEPIGEQVAYATQNVSRHSAPSDLEITDMRVAQVGNVPIIRIDTNQGIHGLGDVRDGADKRYALMLKSRLLGENPCNVERLFKRIEQFGHHGRQGGGVSGVEMALWDLTGKAYGVPVYQLLGGKYRDEIRIYVDTPTVSDPDEFADRIQGRIESGFDFVKMDIGIGLIDHVDGTITNKNFWAGDDGELHAWGNDDVTSYAQTEHGLTRIQITEKGIEMLAEYPAAARERIGYEVPLATDHMGHISVNSCIRVTNAFEPYNMAWMEDLVPWFRTDQWKEITGSVNVPTITGEDVYRLEGFKELIEERAVDVVHPDPVSAGGCLQTKKIGDYAEEHGIAMALHHASSPVSFMASCHAAAATRNFVALEHHHVDTEYWEDLVTGIEKPIVNEGYVSIPEKPGIGVELNEEVVREHLAEGEEYFAPTDDWNELESWDRLWS